MEITSKVDAVLKGLKRIGVKNEGINYQLGPDELVEQTLLRGEGVLNDTGALCINTGTFTLCCTRVAVSPKTRSAINLCP